MTVPVKEQLITMVALQKTETDIALTENFLAGVEEQIQQMGSRISQIKDDVKQSQDLLDSLKKQYRDHESEVKSLENKRLRSEEKLRAVKTNKEYQSMLKEIDELKLKASEIEDLMLLQLDQIEAVESQLKAKSKDLAVFQNEIEQQQMQTRQSAEEQMVQLKALKEKRDMVFGQLSPQLQKLFQKVRLQGRGIAVAAVDSAVCQVCHMNIPPQLFNELLRLDDLRNCPNCQRIIYPVSLFD
jgi:predicted  nucleic acid-binding Zn-ribbon protein